MEVFTTLKGTHKDMEILNRCRLFLQVITLSDITNAGGDHLIIEAKNRLPLSSRPSSLLWPTRALPLKPTGKYESITYHYLR
jgi:hypothetical protein